MKLNIGNLLGALPSINGRAMGKKPPSLTIISIIRAKKHGKKLNEEENDE